MDRLSVEYGMRDGGAVRALDGVSLSLDGGKAVGIAGESACGKSTLGLAIVRMLQGGRVTSGTALLDGEPVLEMDPGAFDRTVRWKRVAMVFQGAMNALDPVFTVKQQMAEALDQHGFKGDREARMLEAIASVGLDGGVLRRFPHELSGGMRQRVVIAIALLLRPALVIADEPTTALDVLVQAQIIGTLKDLKERGGMSFMLITHDLAVLSEVCESIGIMYAGQMVEFGPAEQIYRNPRHPYTKGLLESIPTLRGPRPGHIPGDPPSLLAPPSGCRFLGRCPRAMEKCGEEPPGIGMPEGGYVKCWLHEEDAGGRGGGVRNSASL